MTSKNQDFDFIIVGAGSAGCVLANRLSADPGTKVLVLEAGRESKSIYVHMPAGFAVASTAPRFGWNYDSDPEPGLDGRTMPCPRGRLLGGSSSINGMAFVRGNRADYDTWARAAGPEWSYENCLPAFKSLETFKGVRSAYRGDRGPLSVIAPVYSNPLNEIFLRACAEAGYPINPDTNGASQDGFGPMDQTIRDGRRDSAATAFLNPARSRPNLTVWTDALATRVLIEHGRAIGVEVLHRGARKQVHAGEVILSAGAINSPHLLMLSGVGPAEHLRHFGIDVKADIPGVGQGLEDHADFSLKVECTEPISASHYLSNPRKTLVGIEWLLRNTGPGATNHFEVAGYIRADGSAGIPDAQLCFVSLLVRPDGTRVGKDHGYQITVMVLRPESRGAVTLASADPLVPPRMLFNYIAEAYDRKVLRDGLRAARRIVAEPAMAKVSGKEVQPGADVISDDDIDRYMRATVKSTHHPCATCKMGSGEMDVTDSSGRVRGIANLRVVDASIMPRITSGNINAPTLMLAEKISAVIVGRNRLPLENVA
ncbi:MAG: choline dehydrogenase [Pseudorhodoplanes sp.]